MKFFQIEYLIVVCKYGSISKAADELMISRPAVSRALRELEDEYGIELFVRTTTGISLTENGMIFYEKCNQIYEMVKNLDKEMSALKEDFQNKENQKVRLGLSPTANMTVLPKFYNKFAQKHPHIVLEPFELLASQSAVMLDEGSLDVSITVDFSPPPEVLSYRDIKNVELVFVCSKNHPLADKTSVTVENIHAEPIILLDQALMKGRLVCGLYEKYGFTPNLKFRTSQISMVRQMISTGMCCSVQFRGIIDMRDDIIEIPFKERIVYPLRLTWNENVRHNRAFHEFMAFWEQFVKYNQI